MKLPITDFQGACLVAVALVGGVASVMAAAKVVDADRTDAWSAIKCILMTWVVLFLTFYVVDKTPLAKSEHWVSTLIIWTISTFVSAFVALTTMGTTWLRSVILINLATFFHVALFAGTFAAITYYNGQWPLLMETLTGIWAEIQAPRI